VVLPPLTLQNLEVLGVGHYDFSECTAFATNDKFELLQLVIAEILLTDMNVTPKT
jgi:hypothetical protein